MRPNLLWSALVLGGCSSAAQTQAPAEQPAQVMGAPLGPKAAAELQGRGDPWRCTEMIGAVREQAERVSRAYENLERTADLAAFEREVRTASEVSARLRMEDPKLNEIAGRYRAALLHQIEEVRGRAGGKAPVLGQGALDEETKVIDALIDYCGVNREE